MTRVRSREQMDRKNQRARKANSEGKFTKRHLKTHKDLGDYIVYKDGRVFSKRRGIFVVAALDKDGYPVLRAPKLVKLHRLLAIHFIPNPKEYPLINHKDGNKGNFSLSNLEWCTPKHNMHHAYSSGLISKPYKTSGNFNSGLTIKYMDALIIKEALAKGFTGANIARYYKVNRSTIYKIKHDQTWRGVL